MTEVFAASPVQLVIATLLGFTILIFMITRLKIHALLSIIISAVVIGVVSGMPLQLITKAVADGMGNTLRSIALIVGLGAMFGGILEVSGAAEAIANRMIKTFGEKRSGLALGVAGIFIGIPVFYDPAFIILIPLVYNIAAKTNKSMLYYVLPMSAGLGIGAALPPTPAPMLIAGQLGITLGEVTLVAAILTIPKFIISYFVANKFASKIDVPVPVDAIIPAENKNAPAFGKVMTITLLPLFLILVNATAAMIKTDNAVMAKFLEACVFIGQPYLALALSCLAGLLVLGVKQGIGMEELEKVMVKSLHPVAMIVLVTAGGGVLRYTLDYSGMGRLIGSSLQDAHLPIMLVTFIISTLLRIAVGSTTVSLTMTLGILASFPQLAGYSPLYVACIGMMAVTGATSFSHVNDSGFWLTKQYLDLDLKTAMKSWSLFTGISSLLSFPLIWLVALLFA